MKFYREELSRLESQLEQLELDTANIYNRAEKGIALCRDTLGIMRKRVLKKGFKDIEGECQFFKTIKPKVVGYLIHFVNLVAIERNRPMVSKKIKHSFYIEQIAALKSYFVEQREFYEYYIRELSDRDTAFFTRNSAVTTWYCASIASIIDPNFSSSKDMVLAKILGNSLTINYLKHKLSRKKGRYLGENGVISTLKWTGAKVDLVELVYAVHSSGMVNNGQASLNDLAKVFETIFQKDMGDFYRTFLEIRLRKTNQTKLLDILKTSLLKKIIKADV